MEVQLDIDLVESREGMHDDSGGLGSRKDLVVDDEHVLHRLVLCLGVKSLLLDSSDVEDILQIEERIESQPKILPSSLHSGT